MSKTTFSVLNPVDTKIDALPDEHTHHNRPTKNHLRMPPEVTRSGQPPVPGTGMTRKRVSERR